MESIAFHAKPNLTKTTKMTPTKTTPHQHRDASHPLLLYLPFSPRYIPYLLQKQAHAVRNQVKPITVPSMNHHPPSSSNSPGDNVIRMVVYTPFTARALVMVI